MNTQEQDVYWMTRALELARRGIGLTSPNPAGGCVVLDCAGQVIGEGGHEYDLLDHAEAVALNEARQHAASAGTKDPLRGGTAYRTAAPFHPPAAPQPCT